MQVFAVVAAGMLSEGRGAKAPLLWDLLSRLGVSASHGGDHGLGLLGRRRPYYSPPLRLATAGSD